jgi:hypothetical protein
MEPIAMFNIRVGWFSGVVTLRGYLALASSTILSIPRESDDPRNY